MNADETKQCPYCNVIFLAIMLSLLVSAGCESSTRTDQTTPATAQTTWPSVTHTATLVPTSTSLPSTLASTDTSTPVSPTDTPAPIPTATLPPPEPSVTFTPEPPAPDGNCDPSYPDVCIPPPPPDLNCGDIPYRQFTVLQPDPHCFDGNKDGIGCEN